MPEFIVFSHLHLDLFQDENKFKNYFIIKLTMNMNEVFWDATVCQLVNT